MKKSLFFSLSNSDFQNKEISKKQKKDKIMKKSEFFNAWKYEINWLVNWTI